MADMPKDLVKELARIAGELEEHLDQFNHDTEEDARRAAEQQRLHLAHELRALALEVPQGLAAEVTRWQHRWGGLRRFLKDRAEEYAAAMRADARQQNHLQVRVSAYRDVLHEMDMAKSGNRVARENLPDIPTALREALASEGISADDDLSDSVLGAVTEALRNCGVML